MKSINELLGITFLVVQLDFLKNALLSIAEIVQPLSVSIIALILLMLSWQLILLMISWQLILSMISRQHCCIDFVK